MRRFTILMLFVLGSIAGVSAQNISTLSERLAVREVGSAKAVVAEYDTIPAPNVVSGYRVRIFFDSKQNARQASLSVQSQFNALYPEFPSYWSFDQPNYMVTVGNFTTKEEATALVGRIASTFPKAFVLRQNIPISEFGTKDDHFLE